MQLVNRNEYGDRYEETRKDPRPIVATGQGEYSKQLLPKDILPSSPPQQPVHIGLPLASVALVSFLAGVVACLMAIALFIRCLGR